MINPTNYLNAQRSKNTAKVYPVDTVTEHTIQRLAVDNNESPQQVIANAVNVYRTRGKVYGYKNFESWTAFTWLTDDYRAALTAMAESVRENDDDPDQQHIELADLIKEFVEEQYYDSEINGLFSDLLTHALQAVDWSPLARYLLAD